MENGAPCTCCGDRTIPSHKDMISYICPICYWKIDVFLSGEEEPSDENHGLTLKEAGKILSSMAWCCHPESGIAGCPRKARKDGKKETFKKGRNRHDNIATGILRPHERDIRQGI